MTTEVTLFQFEDREMRTLTIDSEPWWVAKDVAEILEYRMASDMTRVLDTDERRTHSVRTSQGPRKMTVISQPGLFSAIMRSQSSSAKPFQRWVTHEVLPAIWKTGEYAPQRSNKKLEDLTKTEIWQKVIFMAQTAISRENQLNNVIDVLTPKAEVFDSFLSASGDSSFADVAKTLNRSGHFSGGQNSLFKYVEEIGWLYRRSPKGQLNAFQSAINTGYLTEKPQFSKNKQTGEVITRAPQVRITSKGVAELQRRLGPSNRLSLENMK